MAGERMFRDGRPPEFRDALRRVREKRKGRHESLWVWALGALVLGGTMAVGAFVLAGF
jgi:hypothetical protein